MEEDSDRQPFVDRLGQVKDAIGEWHDWEALVAIGGDVLDHGRNCRLMKSLKNTAVAKFETALRLSETMRRDDLQIRKGHTKNRSKPRKPQQAESVRSATESLAA